LEKSRRESLLDPQKRDHGTVDCYLPRFHLIPWTLGAFHRFNHYRAARRSAAGNRPTPKVERLLTSTLRNGSSPARLAAQIGDLTTLVKYEQQGEQLATKKRSLEKTRVTCVSRAARSRPSTTTPAISSIS